MSICSSTFRIRCTQGFCNDSVVYATVKDWTLLKIWCLWPVYSSKTYNQLSADFCHSTRWTQAKQNGTTNCERKRAAYIKPVDCGQGIGETGRQNRDRYRVAHTTWLSAIELCVVWDLCSPCTYCPAVTWFLSHSQSLSILLFLIYFSSCIK